MEHYQFPSHYPHQSRLTGHDSFVHASPSLDPYSKVGAANYSILCRMKLKLHPQMSEEMISSPRHGGSHQVYASPIAMDPMPMLLYPGASTTPPQYTNPNQYPYDNLRLSPTLENNYMTMSPHYEVLPSNSSRGMDFGVRILFIYPFYLFLFTKPIDSYTGGYSYCETTEVQRTLDFVPGNPDPFPGSRLATESIDIGCAVQHSPTARVATATCATPTIPASTL